MNRDSNNTFDEIAARKGEEAAIQAGIEADPDAYELDSDWFRHASPAKEMLPHIRASFSWITADNRTDFQLFVDKMLVASGHILNNMPRLILFIVGPHRRSSTVPILEFYFRFIAAGLFDGDYTVQARA